MLMTETSKSEALEYRLEAAILLVQLFSIRGEVRGTQYLIRGIPKQQHVVNAESTQKISSRV